MNSSTFCPPLNTITVGIDVDLGHLDLAVKLLGHLVEDGRKFLARAAPGGPKIDDNRDLGLDDLGLESRLGDIYWCTHGFGSFADSLLRCFPTLVPHAQKAGGATVALGNRRVTS